MKDDARIHAAAVVLLAAVAFSGTLANGFVWDDFDHILHNPVLQRLDTALEYFTAHEGLGSGRQLPYYRPVTMFSFALDHALWGAEPRGYHAISLTLHLVACALVYLVVRRFTMHPEAAFAAALLFAAHPAHAGPVAYVSARADLLCGVFLLAAFLGYLVHVESGGKAALAGALAAFTLAALSKENALLFPAVLAAHALLISKSKRALRHLLPFVGVTAAVFLARSLVLEVETWDPSPVAVRLFTAPTLVARYLVNTLVPVNLQVFYDIPLRTSFTDPVVLVSLAATAGLAYALFRLSGRVPGAVFGAAWFFILLVPATGIVTLIYPSLMADRYLYVPLAGAAIAAGAVMDRMMSGAAAYRPLGGRRLLSAAVLVSALFCAIALARVAAYKNPLILWNTAASQAPTNPYVLNRLGCALILDRRFAEAESVFERMLAMDPDDPAVHTNMGYLSLRAGELAEAERHAYFALSRAPGDWICHKLLGQINAAKGDRRQAELFFRRSLAINPYDGATRRMLDYLLEDGGPAGGVDARAPAGRS